MNNRLRMGVLVFACLVSSAYAERFAPERPPRAEAPADNTRAPKIGLNEAAEMVQRQAGGRILAAQNVMNGGRASYRIKMLSRQGEVRVIFVDAETGAME